MVIGLLAAALSSFNSAINAMASSFVADIYMPLRKRMGHAITSDSDQMSSSKKKWWCSWGPCSPVFAIVTAVMQEKSGLNLVDFATGVMSFSYAGMLGVFPVRAFHRTGQYAERRRGARRRPAGRPIAATLCARPVERMARRPPRKTSRGRGGARSAVSSASPSAASARRKMKNN